MSLSGMKRFSLGVENNSGNFVIDQLITKVVLEPRYPVGEQDV
jgi:hypothetical protein